MDEDAAKKYKAYLRIVNDELKGERAEYFAGPDFPLRGLDLTPYLSPESEDRYSSNPSRRTYDLVATVSHLGAS